MEAAPVEAPDQVVAQDGFCWTKQWYALAVEELTDPTRPTPVQLLGKSLVLWKAGDGAWRCFEDRCPHRAAPLSEGKVWGDGTLMCSYHGWRFDGGGACVKIPQAASPEAERAACASPRSCAVGHPVKLGQGVIFVWGEAGPQAVEESERVPLPVDPLLAAAQAQGDPNLKMTVPRYHRDLPYDWATLVENVVDPAHVPFSHHGTPEGNRDTVEYGDSEMWLAARSSDKEVQVERTTPFGPGVLTFKPPGHVRHAFVRQDGASSFTIYSTPTAPGHSRVVLFGATNRSALPLFGSLIFRISMALPSWVNHVAFRHPVFDGDSVFLHYQEQLMCAKAREQGTGWKETYFLPTSADTLVAAFRSWVDRVGQGGPFGPLHQAPGYPPLVTDRRVLLNRYEQHTKSCTKCLKALAATERFRDVAAAAAAVAWALVLVTALQWFQARAAAGAMAVLPVLPLAVGGGTAVALTLAWRVLRQLVQAFYFVDYVHATR